MPRPLAPPILLLVLLLGLAACGGPEAPGRPGRGVVVVAVDAWRRDHLSLYGYGRPTTPGLQAFADECVVFDDAWSPQADLRAAHASLLTGCEPELARSPGVPLGDGTRAEPVFDWSLPRDVPRLSLEFLRHGTVTGAFVDHPRLAGLNGITTGFHDYAAFGGDPAAPHKVFGFEGVGRRFIEWLKARQDGEEWFAYVHMNDLERMWTLEDQGWSPDMAPRPGLDHVPPVGASRPTFHGVPWTRRGDRPRTLGELEATYDTALSRMDHNLERFLLYLRESCDWERTTVVLVGTYGLCLGEGGLVIDAGGLSEADLRVPLMVRPAPELGFPVGRHSAALVNLSDVAPTVLALAGVPLPGGQQGRSLVPVLAGRTDSVRDVTHARAAVMAGTATVTTDLFLSELRPSSLRGRQALTFLGTQRREDLPDLRERRGRTPEAVAGLAGGDPDWAARAEQLARESATWYADLERARDVLHLAAWDARYRDPDLVAELRARGLLATPAGGGAP